MALKAFEAFGIEIEWTIVDNGTLDPRSLADHVLREEGMVLDVVDRGETQWSNELARHIIEVKTAAPVGSLDGIGPMMLEQARSLNRLLSERGAQLLGGGMHPWLDPDRGVELWPYGQREVYEAYDRIFDCRRHGWLNVQAVHLNLGFDGDEEFVKLHDAIRLVLPLIPALAAASPFAGGRFTGDLDHRIVSCAETQARIPSIAGSIIPERIESGAEYKSRVLDRMYRAIAPHDCEHLLRFEWLNSRGVIPRFDRDALEIRLIDAQESPLADAAIAAAIAAVLRGLFDGVFPGGMRTEVDTSRLRSILDETTTQGDLAVITDRDYLSVFGLPDEPVRAGEIWRRLLERTPTACVHDEALSVIFQHGTLARRMLRAVGPRPTHQSLHALASALATSMNTGRLFVPDEVIVSADVPRLMLGRQAHHRRTLR